MQIGKDKVVTFHYKLSEADAGLLEDSRNGEPLTYLHGHGGIIAGLEDALDGRQAGEAVSVTLAPEQAYGLRDERAVMRVPKSHIIGGKNANFQPGQMVRINTSDGQRVAVVVKSGLKMIDVDTNHPLAGRTLSFEIDIVGVRDATEEELLHRHAHGEHGHDAH